MTKTEIGKIYKALESKDSITDIAAEAGLNEQDTYKFLVSIQDKLNNIVTPKQVSVDTNAFKEELLAELAKRNIQTTDEEINNFLTSVNKQKLAVQRAADLIGIKHKKSNTFVYTPPNLQ